MVNNSEVLKQNAKSSVVQLFIAICSTFVAVFGLFHIFNGNIIQVFMTTKYE